MVLRSCGLIAGMAVLALVVVFLRAAQVRSAGRILAHESQWLELRRELWSVQTQAARLKTPESLYDRMELFGADVARREAGGPLRRISKTTGNVPRD
jgi:hypothetical protein